MLAVPRKPIRILLIDNHTIMRAGLRLLVESLSKVIVVGEAQNRVEALEIAAREQPDIMLVDLDLGGESGLDLIPELHATVKQGRVIVLTGLRNSEEQARAVQLGARGLVLKEDVVSNLINAIERVHQGECWFEPSMSANLLGRIARVAQRVGKIDPEEAKIAALTERELKIISLVGEGLRNQQIADRLFISEGTVRNHLTVIYEKMGVSTRFELIVYASRHGLANPTALAAE
ncbi:MAG: response regulator transcription factor [Acidobacteria bacterium]|nr:response regulator transcription factor [Acidobacteriota bacterium]